MERATANRRVAAQNDSIYLRGAGRRYGRNIGDEIQVARQPPAAQGQFTVFCIQVKQGPNSRLASEASVAKRTGDAFCVSRLTTELPIAETQSVVSVASALGTGSAMPEGDCEQANEAEQAATTPSVSEG